MVDETNSISWWRIIIQAGFIVIPLLLGGYVAWKRLWWVLTEYRPHYHTEDDAPLHAAGIRYPRSMRDKSDP